MNDKSQSFEDCKFSREIYGEQIINIIKNINHISSEFKSTVIALDAPWGTGKSTFINMLSTKIQIEEPEDIVVVKYNSWANDMHSSALECLLYNIMTNEYFNDTTRNKDLFLKVAEVIKFATKSVVRHKLGSEAVEEIEDLLKAGDSISAIGSFKEIKAVNETYINFKKAFKKTLREKKILIVIDELDRCKPTFAIETLEVIKHLFDIENVAFLLSMDMDQLKHSIATVYGQNMDSVGYLNKFVNYKLRLPPPDRLAYVEYLIDSKGLLNNSNSIDAINDMKSLLAYNKLSIRDINMIFNDFYLVYTANNFNSKQFNLSTATIYLYFIILRYLKPVEVSDNPVNNMTEFFEIYNNLELNNLLISLVELDKTVIDLAVSKEPSEYRISNTYRNRPQVPFFAIKNVTVREMTSKMFRRLQTKYPDRSNRMKLHEYINMEINMIANRKK